MNVLDFKERIERLDHLIKQKATGSPEELAKRFNCTERTIYRMISQLKEMGCPVYYDKTRQSYCYEKEGCLKFVFEKVDSNVKK